MLRGERPERGGPAADDGNRPSGEGLRDGGPGRDGGDRNAADGTRQGAVDADDCRNAELGNRTHDRRRERDAYR